MNSQVSPIQVEVKKSQNFSPYIWTALAGIASLPMAIHPLFWLLLVVAPVPALYFSLKGSIKRAIVLGLIYGFISSSVHAWYVLTPIPIIPKVGIHILYASVLGSYFIITRVIIGYLFKNSPKKAALVIPWLFASVIAASGLITRFPYTGEWIPFTMEQIHFSWNRAIASVAGLYGILFITAVIAGIGVQFLFNCSKWSFINTGVLLVFCVGLILGGYNQSIKVKREVTVAAVTTVLPPKIKQRWLSPIGADVRSEDWKGVYEKFINLTNQAATKGAKIVAWPEVALFIPKQKNEQFIQDNVTKLAKKLGITIIVGYAHMEAKKNMVFGVTSSGETMTYAKHYLVPGPAVTLFDNNTSERFGMLYDKKTDLKIGVRICYDNDFPIGTREAVKAGADIMVTPYADWNEIVYRHAKMGALRNAENHISTLRPSFHGLSTLVGPKGEFLQSARSDNNGDVVLVGKLPVTKPGTIYTKYGNWLGWLSVVIIILVGGFVIFNKSYKPATSSQS